MPLLLHQLYVEGMRLVQTGNHVQVQFDLCAVVGNQVARRQRIDMQLQVSHLLRRPAPGDFPEVLAEQIVGALLVLERLDAGSQLIGRLVVELPQQCALPIGPGVGRDRRQIGVGDQIERLQPLHIGEDTGEFGNHRVVVKIAAA